MYIKTECEIFYFEVSSRDPEDPGSPFIDVEGLSDEDVEPMTSSTATTKQQQQQQQQSKSDQPSTSSTYLATERGNFCDLPRYYLMS